MKVEVPKIYIFAPQGAGFAFRKLRGLASSLGITTQILSDIKTIPRIPDDNSILILTDSVKIPKFDNHDSNWRKIFVWPSDSSTIESRAFSYITLDGPDSHGLADIQLLHGILLLFDIPSHANWHSILHQGQGDASKLDTYFSDWAQSLQIENFTPAQTLIKAMQGLRENMEHIKTQFQFETDGHSVQIEIKVFNQLPSVLSMYKDCLTCPQAHINIYSQTAFGCRIVIKSDLIPRTKARIRIVDLDVREEIASDQQEAS